MSGERAGRPDSRPQIPQFWRPGRVTSLVPDIGPVSVVFVTAIPMLGGLWGDELMWRIPITRIFGGKLAK